jgi:hypothetical protein
MPRRRKVHDEIRGKLEFAAADLGDVQARSAVQSIEKDLTASEIRAAREIWLPRAIASMRQ